MAFEDICREVVQDTEGTLGCLLVDLHTGLALAAAQSPAADITSKAAALSSEAGLTSSARGSPVARSTSAHPSAPSAPRTICRQRSPSLVWLIRRQATRPPCSRQNGARNSRLRILPEPVLGISPVNATERGIL